MRAAAVVTIVSLLFFACGDGASDAIDAASDDDDDDDLVDAAVGPTGAAAWVRVEQHSDDVDEGVVDRTVIAAELRAAAPPTLYVEAQAEGECRRVRRVDAFCDPACDADELCTGDGVCTAIAPARSAGTLVVEAGGVERTLEASAGGGYRLDEQGAIFPDGATISASAEGDAFDGFDVSAVAPAPLVLLDARNIGIAVGQELALAWEPGDETTRVRITIISDDAGHGLWHPSVIECDVADSGAFTVPQALVDAHADTSNWGCGFCLASSMERYRAAEASGVELVLASQTWLGVRLGVSP